MLADFPLDLGIHMFLHIFSHCLANNAYQLLLYLYYTYGKELRSSRPLGSCTTTPRGWYVCPFGGAGTCIPESEGYIMRPPSILSPRWDEVKAFIKTTHQSIGEVGVQVGRIKDNGKEYWKNPGRLSL